MPDPEFFFIPAPWAWFWLACLGLCVGSFLNVVIYRLPRMMMLQEAHWAHQVLRAEGGSAHAADPAPLDSDATGQIREPAWNLAVPGSTCMHCGHRISALENIPLLSWLWLRGCCRVCGIGISLRYPLVELAGCLLAVVAILTFGWSWAGAFTCLFGWLLLALLVIDLQHMLLPDDLVLPLLWLGLLANLFDIFAPLSQAVAGAMVGYGVLWLLYWGFKLLTGKEGMGYGDFKLMAAMGAWLGWAALPQVALLASAAGIMAALLLMLAGKLKRDMHLPFGPFIAVAGWLMLVLPFDINAFFRHGSSVF